MSAAAALLLMLWALGFLEEPPGLWAPVPIAVSLAGLVWPLLLVVALGVLAWVYGKGSRRPEADPWDLDVREAAEKGRLTSTPRVWEVLEGLTETERDALAAFGEMPGHHLRTPENEPLVRLGLAAGNILVIGLTPLGEAVLEALLAHDVRVFEAMCLRALPEAQNANACLRCGDLDQDARLGCRSSGSSR